VILVTGGAGYIGSHTVKALKSAGFSPIIFDNFSTGHRSFIHDTPLIEGDLRDPADVKAVFSKYNFRAVLHFAGKALVGESHQHPGSYYEVNVGGGLNLLAAMMAADVKVLIFSSTCATYGVPTDLPIREDHPQLPISPTEKPSSHSSVLFNGSVKHTGFRIYHCAILMPRGRTPMGSLGKTITLNLT
jgi:UDP-glucose 4-epimerase